MASVHPQGHPADPAPNAPDSRGCGGEGMKVGHPGCGGGRGEAEAFWEWGQGMAGAGAGRGQQEPSANFCSVGTLAESQVAIRAPQIQEIQDSLLWMVPG